MNRDYPQNSNRRSLTQGIPFKMACAVSGNFRLQVNTKRPEVRGGVPGQDLRSYTALSYLGLKSSKTHAGVIPRVCYK